MYAIRNSSSTYRKDTITFVKYIYWLTNERARASSAHRTHPHTKTHTRTLYCCMCVCFAASTKFPLVKNDILLKAALNKSGLLLACLLTPKLSVCIALGKPGIALSLIFMLLCIVAFVWRLFATVGIVSHCIHGYKPSVVCMSIQILYKYTAHKYTYTIETIRPI